MKRLLSIAIISVILFSCDVGENPPVPDNQLVIYVHENYKPDRKRSYAILNDSNGGLLDYKEIVPGDSLIFTLSPSPEYHLTIYSFADGIDGFSTLRTYQNIFRDKPLLMEFPDPNEEKTYPLGDEIEVNIITPYTEIIGGTLSNVVGEARYHPNITPGKVTLKMNRNIGIDGHLVSLLDKDGKPYYKIFSLKENQTSYSFDFSELKNFDQELVLKNTDLNFGQLVVQEMLMEDTGLKGSFVNFFSTDFGIRNNPNKFTLGYLEGNYIHHTYLTAKSKNTNNQYVTIIDRSVGLPNFDFTIPPPFGVQNKNIFNFSFNLSETFTRWKGVWLTDNKQGEAGFNWIIYGSNPTTPSFTLPQELVAENPILKEINKLELNSLSATKGSLTHQEWLENIWGYPKNRIEYQAITWAQGY